MGKTIFSLTIIFLTIGTFFAQTPTPTPKIINSGVINGKAISLIKPVYPTFATSEKPSGEVKVQVIIDEQGNVISAEATSGHPALREASVKAALASKFSPTKLEGQPVKVTGAIIYKFQSDTKPPNYEETLKIMSLGVFLSIAEIMPMSEWETMPRNDLENEKALKVFLLPLTNINPQTSKADLTKIVEQVADSLEKNLIGDDAWQYQFGKEFGKLMLEFSKATQNPTANLDELTVKTNLLKMNQLLSTPPSGIPPTILAKFKEIASFADAENLNSKENKIRLIKLIEETINLISPDSGN
jgi:TonB family protein